MTWMMMVVVEALSFFIQIFEPAMLHISILHPIIVSGLFSEW